VPSTRLIVVRGGLPLPAPAAGETVVSDADVRQWALDGRLLGRLRRYRSARLLTERLSTAGRPMLMWALWLMARRSSIADSAGRERPIGLRELLRWSRQLGAEVVLRPRLLRSVEHEIESLAASAPAPAAPLRRAGVLLYLRTDISFGVRAGGSVGHIAGVLNEFARDGWSPLLLTTTAVPTLEASIETHVVDAPESFWNFAELPALVFGRAFEEQARRVLAGRPVSLVYQRYSLNSYAGLSLARALRVPFVLEYNGSEIWMSRHWSRALRHEALANRIEMLNVTRADLVVVVSRAMRDELVARGVSAQQILVNPNGVDPQRYAPAIDGSAVRRRFGLEGAIVVGFISTFQPWHGAGILAQAFARFVAGRPAQRERVRLFMIGAGPELERTRQIVAAAGLDACVQFTGLIEQADGPQYLAACDVLASPHVPNADGTPFFGSPTKLFEYMAMGKAIVASDLDQIGDVLRHGETAWLVPPANPVALAAAIERLVDDPPLRSALGEAARRDAVAHHTWRAHVERIVAALASRLGVPAA
jgi:glycosyltransferase involved in cell wall biosynthesis